MSVSPLGKVDGEAPAVFERVAHATVLSGKGRVRGLDVDDGILHECSITSAVEEVKHGGERNLGSGPVAFLNDAVSNESVVRATGQVDQLKDLAVISEPLDDVRVVFAGSTLGECFLLLHAPIITHSPGIARGRACICVGFFVCKWLRHKHLGPSAPGPQGTMSRTSCLITRRIMRRSRGLLLRGCTPHLLQQGHLMPPYPLRVRLSCFSVRFMLYIVSEDAEDGKGTEQKTLRFQSLFLRAGLDGLFALDPHSIEDVDDGEGHEHDGEGEELHGYIIAWSPGNASPCPRFFVKLS